MANTTSAQKAARKAKRRTAINKSRTSRMRSDVRKVEEAIATGKKDDAVAALRQAEPTLARSGQTGVVAKRAASRKISRLTKRVMAMA
jgi:small subunit ribosomal protein S20